MATRPEVVEFLQAAKLAIDFDRAQFHPRDRMDQDLIDLNLTRAQAYGVIKRLTPECYSKGPEPDDQVPDRMIWVFGFVLEGVEVYIKLRLVEGERGELPRLVVRSFHRAEHPLRYPLGEARG